MIEFARIVSIVLILLGSFFMLVAAIGVLRLPDLLLRMHAATKAGTLGAGLLLLSTAVVYGETSVTIRAVAAIVFLFLTAPVAAHMIGRAAYLSGEMRLWKNTFTNELAGHYEREAVQAEPAGELAGADATERVAPPASRRAP